MADNLARIRDIIGPSPVKLVAVSKGVEVAKIFDAFNLGIKDFAESRVQDAMVKQDLLQAELGKKISWHFIGHLQKNKVSKVVGRFELIQSIDSFELAQIVSQTALAKGICQKVLLQVKVLPDPNKQGFTPDELQADLDKILAMSGIKIEGLMTICPNTACATIWQNCFNRLKLLQSELRQSYGVELKELSMGMSQDYKEAIACGSTMVRLGRAVFGS